MLIRRFRKKEKKGGFLPILIPVMNLFLLILPLVIQNAYLQRLTTLELQLPTIAESSSSTDRASSNVLLELNEGLIKVFIEEKLIDEFTLSPNFEDKLFNRLKEIKKSLPQKSDILLKIAPQVKYDLVIKVIDICKKDGNLFPNVVFYDEE